MHIEDQIFVDGTSRETKSLDLCSTGAFHGKNKDYVCETESRALCRWIKYLHRK